MSSKPEEPNPKSAEGESAFTLDPVLGAVEANVSWNRGFVEHSGDLLCTHDLEGRFLSVNSESARQLGYTVEELLRIPMRELIPPQFRPQFDEYLKKIAREGEAHGLLTTLARSGERRVWEYHNKLRTEGVPAPVVHGMAHDVTDRRRIDRELRKTTEGFRLLEEYAPALAMFDCEMRYLYASRRWRTDYGLGDRDLRGVSHYDVFPEIPERWKQIHRRALAGEALREGHDRFDRADGSTQWIRWEIRPWCETTGTVGGVVVFAEDVTDITERKQTEEALRQSDERFRVALKNSPITVFNQDRDLRYTWLYNPTLAYPVSDFLGKTTEEFLGTTPGGERVAQIRRQVLETGVGVRHEVTIPDSRGNHYFDTTAEPLFDSAGQVVGITCSSMDITERKRAEEALRESEERMRLAQEVANIGTFDRNLLTGEGRWTPQMMAIFGLGADAPLPTLDQVVQLIHPEDRNAFSDMLAQSMHSGEGGGEWRIVWPDGAVRWIGDRWRVFKDPEGKPTRIIGIDYDITDRKRIEEELRQAKEKLTEEKLYLERTIDSELGFEEIIGRSAGLKAVLELVARVATSDATVLLLGETGVGKELVARAIHRLSSRAGNAFIKMNCAAIPSGLLESELFGAEKGAYTGSVSRKIGRLELADKGTMFLDEIGDIALALQPKLLRVLQDQEFERLGGTQTLKVNFRLIAATNHDLADDVQRNQFRSDLFYRLNVFPIVVPPLRKRRDDIPLLVEYFVQKCSRRLNKLITSIPKRTMAALTAWDWPGNVRELENFIERSVILTNGSVLAAPLGELQARMSIEEQAETLEAVERKRILEALQQSKGRISGEQGAAARLGLKRTTLQSKLKQLRINPRTPPLN